MSDDKCGTFKPLSTVLVKSLSIDKELANIAQTKGQLAVDKGAKRYDALQNYQSALQAVDARNTAFKQQLYTTAQDHAQKLAELKASVNNKYQVALQSGGLTNGQQITSGGTTYTVVPNSSGTGIQYLSGKINDPTDPNSANYDPSLDPNSPLFAGQ